MESKTISSLKSFITHLNIGGGNPDDIENFYDFCIESFLEAEIIEKDHFFEIFKSSFNVYNNIKDNNIKEYFLKYNEYMQLFEFMEKKGILNNERIKL
ncbi:MAG: hypothetical protein PHS49_01475 [Candidatus Gracilibacteria bacterium]|nr:hypothetical protein [Candidatus Gracilibacteria bacterium]